MSRSTFLISLSILVLTSTTALGTETFNDDFATGIDPSRWTVTTSGPLYTVDGSQGDVHISKPIGGSGFQYAWLVLECDFGGDFDVSVDFSDAMITRMNGAPGNQVQLTLSFGGQLFVVVRSDELPGGDNIHVFVNPPGTWVGEQPTSVTEGTLRVTRSGSVVSGYLDGNLIHSGTYNDAPVTFLTLALQNNGTNDPTSVTFDNFSLVAGSLDCPLVSAAGGTPTFSAPSLSNYPNPFNPATTISLVLPRDDHVALGVFDLTGRLVTSLLDERLEAGSYRVRWDGRDHLGAPVGSGVYHVQLRAGELRTTRKIVLLK